MKLPRLFRSREKAISPVAQSRGSWYPVFESYSGAWQSNVVVSLDSVLSNPYIFACQTLIARDIAKLRVRLIEREGKVWKEVSKPSFSPVLRKPNAFQTRNQFWESWMLSKLSRGNTYVLKQRDQRGVVVGMYVLDPTRVTPLVADDGSVFYDLSVDNISGIEEQLVVPAREVIHDRWNTLFHPLVGLSPIFANGVAATQGLRIQDNSATFFGNQSNPSGILSAPGKISDETAGRLKTSWEANYTGANAGKVAVLGDGLAFQQMAVSAEDSQMVEQLKWTAEAIAATYHVPLYKIGAGPVPTAGNVQTLNLEYYSQCLQSLIEDAESLLNEGLGLDGHSIGTEFDTENLLRMDSKTQMETLALGTGAGIIAPDEARERVNRGPVPGGGMPYLQQQNYSLEALAKRDAREDPWAGPATPEPPTDEEPDLPPEERRSAIWAELRRAAV
ncbi:phage portal protein [Roseovarius indicus]|uniref:Phage portal protein, HK97 family n=1 Tax=Roseovarius indicus TaxID=540747 RepID=A0A0T5P8A3_9RHOB|nr:phage portal protein [Roseovarius indicus]KRS17527.1 poly(3-hydroxybutyrate) depolymerase [Roseovarius indicus]QEW26730.1 phage portal protein, HK97 family [Roseovarius indicus]SFD60955.1 phage portal protein, HK97 family [Roseovarius indicus]